MTNTIKEKATLESIQGKKNVSTEEAAQILGKSVTFVREGLKQKTLPIGCAVQSEPGNGKWDYHISPGLLTEYVSGTSLKNYYEENKEYLKKALGL